MKKIIKLSPYTNMEIFEDGSALLTKVGSELMLNKLDMIELREYFLNAFE